MEAVEDDIPIIHAPKKRTPKASIWKDLISEDAETLMHLDSRNDIEAVLKRTNLLQYDNENQFIIMFDFYFHTLQYCKDNSFSVEQISAIFSIFKQIHEMAIETPFGNINETFLFFKNLLLCHSIHRPPFSLGIFTSPEIASISQYFVDTYFRHFKLYKYVFTPQVKLDITVSYSGIPKTPEPEAKEEHKTILSDGTKSKDEKVEKELTNVLKNEFPSDGKSESVVDTSTASDKGNVIDSPSMVQLKSLIRSHLTTEINELKDKIDSQLKVSEENITKLVSNNPETARKSAKGSAKGKKK